MKIKRTICCLLTLVIAGSTLVTAIGCGAVVVGSGKLVTRDFDYSDFNKLNVSHAFQVEVTRADSFFVSLTMDDNLFDYLNIRKLGSTLYIGLKTPRSYVSTTQRATITMPDLHGLKLSGASTGDVSGFSSEDTLNLDLSGASSLDIEEVTAGNTDFNISGASKLSGSMEIDYGNFEVSGASSANLDGSADDMKMDVSGTSTMRLDDFTVENANIILSDASTATVNASGRIDAEISGASNLYYIGSPTLGRLDVSGASNIRQK